MAKHLPLLLLFFTCLWLACNLDKTDDPLDPCANPPSAEFTPDQLSGNAPLTVNFDNNSTGGATTYLWTFSPGATSSLAEPSHTFTSPGTYSVSLVATSSTGCKDTAMATIVVNPAGPVPVAGFSITNGGCIAPCDVVFTNTSTDATSFEWDFGDGSPVVTQGNPTHKYELPGDYVVKLTATGAGGTDTETKTVLVKTHTFKKTFGGTSDEEGRSVQQTSDGGYILFGYTDSEGAGGRDFYLIKTSNSGSLVWKRTFGGTYNEEGYSVQETSDGGYILLGQTYRDGFQDDFYLLKTDYAGNIVWDKTIGNILGDYGYSVRQTTDGGYILLGSAESISNPGDLDVFLVKTDNFGNMAWFKKFEETGFEEGQSVQQTSDGGFVLLGYTGTGGAGSWDVYLIKTDELGNMVWKKTYGGAGSDFGLSVRQTSDGGYILLGFTQSEGAGSNDFYLIKTDNAGNLIWKKTFGGINGDSGWSVQETAGGGFILFGSTQSEGAGLFDFYLIKTNDLGEMTWKKTFGGVSIDQGYCVQQTTDGGFILLGFTESEGAGGRDFYLVKTDKDGNVQ